jgi:hypothetical protein
MTAEATRRTIAAELSVPVDKPLTTKDNGADIIAQKGDTHAMKATPGTVIAARPWAGGKPLPRAERGIVLETWNGDSGDVLVWFPGRGRPDEPGTAVQPILAPEIQTVNGLDTCSRRWVADVTYALIGCGVWNELPASDRAAIGHAIGTCYTADHPRNGAHA